MLSFFMCSVASVAMIFSDFGKQEHVFTPVQHFLFAKIDTFFKITEEDINRQIAINISQLNAEKEKLPSPAPVADDARTRPE